VLAQVVRKVDNVIQVINHYPVNSVVCFINTYPLDSDLSGGQRYPAFKQLRPDGKGCDPNWYLVVHGEKTIIENSI